MDRINEDAYAYISPLLNGPTEDSLLSQLLKCKGKMDTLAINCLKEMLSLMAKDDDIARFVYFSAPPTYQMARYSDWIKSYLEYHKAEVERANSYSYFKAKYESVLAGLELYKTYDEKCNKFREEEKESFEKFKQEASYAEISQDWLAY